ncbi:MAG: lectin-like domain-containing protein, partial [Planctomycetaceae bacterium]
NVQAQLLNPLNQAYTLGGQVSVVAQSTNNVLAETGLGLDTGLLYGAGAYLGTATAQPNVAAVLQANLTAQDDLEVSAEAKSQAAAHVKSGFGSLIGGVGTTATTNSSPTVATTVGGTLSSGGDLKLGAANTSTYSAVADNSDGGVLGVGSGTTGTNNGSATVTATIQANSVLAAADGLYLVAVNEFRTTQPQPSVTGVGGAIGVDTDTVLLNTALAAAATVNVGSGASLTGAGTGGVNVGAITNANINESADASSGAMVDNSTALTTLTLDFTPAVNVGANAVLAAPQGMLALGTLSDVAAQTTAQSDAYGLMTVSVAQASVEATVDPVITIGSNANLTGQNIAISTQSLPSIPYGSAVDATSIASVMSYGFPIPSWRTRSSATINSNAQVTIGSGALVAAQQDVTLEALPMPAEASAQRDVRETYGKKKSPAGNVARNLNGTLTIDGTVIAGAANTLDIVIPEFNPELTTVLTVNGQSATSTYNSGLTGTTPAITPSSSASSSFIPFSFASDDDFNVQSLLTGLSPANLALLSGFISSTPVYTLQLSNVQAAGGQVLINATGLQGSGTVEANLPEVNIVNNSAAYLLLDGVALLGGTNAGQISFAGTATGSSAPQLTLKPYASGVTSPTVNVQLTDESPVGTTTENAGASLFLTGAVNNPMGSVEFEVANGSFVQQAPINATSITIDVPNGVFLVDSNPPVPYEGVAGDISDAWLDVASSNHTYTGGTPQNSAASQTVPTLSSFFLPGLTSTGYNPNLVVTTAVDYWFNPGGTAMSAFDFVKNYIVGTATNTTDGSATSYIFFGDTIPYCNDDSVDYVNGQSQAGSGSNFLTGGTNGGLTYTLGDGNKNNTGNTPLIMPNLPLKATGTSNTAAAANLTGSITAAAVSITADIIDLNGPINVGHQGNATLRLSPGLGLLLRGYQAQYNQSPATVAAVYQVPAFELPNDVSATYSCLTGEITVSPLTAGSTNAQVVLTGQIMSSVSGASINLNGGAGTCEIENLTGFPVVLQGVGTSAIPRGTVTINDTYALQTTIYAYELGGPVSVYSGTLNTVTATGTPTSTVTGTMATFHPTDNLIYTWENTASVSRPGNDTSNSPPTWYNPYKGNNVDQSINYQGQWTFYSGTSDAPYVASNGTLSVSSQTNPPVFSEQVTAMVNWFFGTGIIYNGYGIGTNFAQTYFFPYDITVTATSSILADNPVTINFGGIVSGSLAVSSNADVILGGPVLLNGSVSLDVNGSLLQQAAAVITAGSLSVNAVGGSVGTTSQPLTLAMLNGGPVSATGTQGVYLASSSDLTVGTISTQTPPSTSVPGNQLISGFNQDGTNWSSASTGAFSPTIADNVMTLTKSGVESTASAWWYDTPLPVNQSFAVSFTYTGQADGAEGVALVFQNSFSGTSAVGAVGAGVGYSGIPNSLALVLDINNENDAGGSGLGISTNGTISPLASTSPVALDSGHPISVLLSYDPVAQTVTVALQDTVTGAQFTSVTPGINLATLVAANSAFLGFTGATGSVTATQTIGNFHWYSSAPASVTTATVAGFNQNGASWSSASNGEFTPTIADNVMTLTKSGVESTANAWWYDTPLPVNQQFVVNFTYTGQADGADGVALVFQNSSSGKSAVGAPGSGVGYLFIADSLALVLDIYGEDGAGGSGMSIATGGSIPTLVDTSPLARDSGHAIDVRLSYDPVAQTVIVLLEDTVTNQQHISVTSNIDLASLVGASSAYLGFTGATGGITATQTISNFTWSASAPVVVTTAAVAGFGTTGTGWTLTPGGGPAASVSNNVLTLTQSGQVNAANAAWANTAVAIDQPFAVSYTYTGPANGADGVAFVLQNDPRGTAAVGSSGGGVGYAGIANSLGVVLDIYSNDGAGGAGFQVATNGTLGTFQSTAPVGLNIGHPIEVGLVYNPQTQILNVTLVDSVTGNVFTSQQSVNLAQIVGSNSAILGFTGATGGVSAIQTISNFQFQPLQSAAFSGGAPWSSVATSGAVVPQIQNNAVQVSTAGAANSATALWYGSQLPVTSPFQVNFTYTGQTTGDEGVAFVLQNDPAGLAALGTSG